MDALTWRLNEGEDVTITDITDDYGVLVLSGPKARDILQPHTPQDLSNDGLKWLRGTVTTVAGIEGVRLLRVSYVGELGWEIHAPMAGLPAIFDALMATGEPMGLKLFGTYAMNSLRMEKAYRGWGSELTQEITMIEADMERFCRFDKEFTGKAATLASKQQGPRIQLAYMQMDATDSDCMGNEPIYQNGEIVGLTTGGAYGHAVKKSLTFAYVDPKKVNMDGGFEIMIYNEKHPARIIPQPAWDPDNERLRA
jgi:dimethylglycine dehydrogenase